MKNRTCRRWKVGDIVYPHGRPQSASIVIEDHHIQSDLMERGLVPNVGEYDNTQFVLTINFYGDRQYLNGENLEDLRAHEKSTRETADRHLKKIQRLEKAFESALS